ncbi:uncharacterized protein L201_007625 [Kwoniella dendrophila CBS 6074]|uniref:Integral membrane protein n=1 Tax=Kwoniella dendrophila CBS 6074 TaxID=1295534 RepID=A0AAX4K4L2_9TREE
MGSVSSALDPARGRGVISVPDGYTTPSFPSLYIPTLHDTSEQRGIFLYEAEAIWHFTLYWTLILLMSLFLLCSAFASFTIFLNITKYRNKPPDNHNHNHKQKSPFSPTIISNNQDNQNNQNNQNNNHITIKHLTARKKPKKPPLWPIIILPIISLFIAAFIGLISSTVVGFALAAIYSAGGFSMSTWVPFLWALIQVLVLIISSYSTLTSIL